MNGTLLADSKPLAADPSGRPLIPLAHRPLARFRRELHPACLELQPAKLRQPLFRAAADIRRPKPRASGARHPALKRRIQHAPLTAWLRQRIAGAFVATIPSWVGNNTLRASLLLPLLCP